MKIVAAIALALVLWQAPSARADGVYGRFDGDVALSLEAGVSEALGAGVGGESLALRGGVFYLGTVGLACQYNEAFDIAALPLARSVVGAIELRPLFLGRWASDLEHGPALLDLFVDSLALGMGIYGAWPEAAAGFYPHHGLELSLGVSLPFIAQASAPFVALRAALRWPLAGDDPGAIAGDMTGLLTLSLGYHHLFSAHLVDAGDRLPP
jgi:hypothetical protein